MNEIENLKEEVKILKEEVDILKFKIRKQEKRKKIRFILAIILILLIIGAAIAYIIVFKNTIDSILSMLYIN